MVGYKKTFQKKNPYTDRREFKSKEIKKSLIHRARLRKNYFKILEKEGITETNNNENKEEEKGEEKAGNRDVYENKYTDSRDAQNSKKPMNFAERSKMAKERKEQARQDKLKSIQDRKETIEKKSRERERRKENLTKKTKSGQPLMGPRINSLLDKIKKDT